MKKKTIIAPKPSPSADPASADAWVSSEKSRAFSNERTKRLTIDVPESLHRRFKAKCAAKGTDMADELRRFLREQCAD